MAHTATKRLPRFPGAFRKGRHQSRTDHGIFEEMVFSPDQLQFGLAKSRTLPQYCRHCAYLKDCWGECPKNRFIRAPDGEPGLNYLCRGFKIFFEHALPAVERIAARLGRELEGRAVACQ